MKPDTKKNKLEIFNYGYLSLAVISLCSLAATFLVSSSDFAFTAKLAIFSLIVLFYLVSCAAIYVWQKNQANNSIVQSDSAKPIDADIEAKLLALEEVSIFFGASLKPADMFRLIASRVNDLTPYSACAVYLTDESGKFLKVAHAAGHDWQKLVGTQTSANKGLTGKCFQSRRPQIENALEFEKYRLDSKHFANLNSAMAVPLTNGENIFGVFAVYGENKNSFDADSLALLEAVGTRVAPLFLSSRAFEETLTNALTDALTNLPNERGFFLVLETQIAESQRFREKRPLTILTIDIKNFGIHNQKFGHLSGDRLLVFAADLIKSQLRQMDFLARSKNDEFLVVLPTATEEITREIIERVERKFVTSPFETSGKENLHLELCFGAASFGKDGETAADLLKHARLRKRQTKETDGKILWFPKEYLN